MLRPLVGRMDRLHHDRVNGNPPNWCLVYRLISLDLVDILSYVLVDSAISSQVC